MKKPLILGLHGIGPRLSGLAGSSWEKFDKRNLSDVEWEELQNRTIVVLGRGAWRSLGLPSTLTFFDRVFTYQIDTKFILIPHPSGRNLWYNSSRNRYRVTRLLRRLAR